MMKKIFALLLCLALTLSLLPTAAHAAEKKDEELLEVTLAVYSNKLGYFDAECLYGDNVLYMHPYTICALTDAYIYDEDDDSITFSIHEDLRMITVSKNGRLEENMNYGPSYLVNADIEVAEYDDTIYINAPVLLRYLGAVVGFGEDENSPTHMMVSMPYTVFDLIIDFSNADGYAFSWAEADGKLVDPEDVLVLAATDTILLGYDSNILAYAVPGHGDRVQKQYYSDVLYEILRTEGAEQLEDGFSYSGLFEDAADTWSFSADWIGEVMDWIEKDTFMPKLHSTMSSAMNATGVLVSAGSDYLESLEAAMQFANMSTTQKNLLDATLNLIPEHNPYHQELPMLFEAAEEVSDIIGDRYAAEEKAAWDGIYSLMMNAGTSAVSGLLGPFNLAWNSLVTIAKLDPMLEDLLDAEQNITYACESQNVAIIARSLVSEDYSNLYSNNFNMLKKDTSVQKSLKTSMILELKAALTARNLLLDTGWLTDSAQSKMQYKAERTAQLLNRAQNAKPTTFGFVDIRDEDITWIQYLAGNCTVGWAQNAGGFEYYWQFTDDDFADGGYFGYFGQVEDTPVEMIRRDKNGKETTLFSTEVATGFVITGGKLYYSAHGELVIYDLKSEELTFTGQWGTLRGVNRSGSYLIYSHDDALYSYRVADGTLTKLASGATYVQVYGNKLYYSKSPSDYTIATMGQISLYSCNMDGSSNILLCTTAPDLYEGGNVFGEAMIAQIRFGKEHIFFSYGSIGGTGMMYQGGNIIRVGYDGSDPTIMATEVGAQFSITEDGKVDLNTEDMYYVLFSSLIAYEQTTEGLLYFDPASGVPEQILPADEYEDATADSSDILHVTVLKGKAYVYVQYGTRDSSGDLGWREYYLYRNSALYVKDLESGELTKLYGT